jgi:hypothetical protein
MGDNGPLFGSCLFSAVVDVDIGRGIPQNRKPHPRRQPTDWSKLLAYQIDFWRSATWSMKLPLGQHFHGCRVSLQIECPRALTALRLPAASIGASLTPLQTTRRARLLPRPLQARRAGATPTSCFFIPPPNGFAGAAMARANSSRSLASISHTGCAQGGPSEIVGDAVQPAVNMQH